MKVHHIKCRPPYFEAVLSGAKPFEVRADDRDYQVGDTLVLKEWSEDMFTGREHRRLVTFVLKDFEGLRPGWVGLGLGTVRT